MVPEAIILALIVGLVSKGRLDRLADAKIKYIWLIFVVLGLSVGMRELVHRDILHYPSYICSVIKIMEFVLLITIAVANLRMSGIKLMLAGLVANLAAIVANGGIMPVSPSGMALTAGKNLPELSAKFPFVKGMLIGPSTRLVPLCDVYPACHPYVIWCSVYSLGDFLTTIGGFIAIVAIMRSALPSEPKPAVEVA